MLQALVWGSSPLSSLPRFLQDSQGDDLMGDLPPVGRRGKRMGSCQLLDTQSV